jgi:hypothetical protein
VRARLNLGKSAEEKELARLEEEAAMAESEIDADAP